jgi:hypothetical protein
MGYSVIDTFKRKALGYLIKNSLEVADSFKFGRDLPDMDFSYRLLSFTRSIKNNHEVYSDDELLKIIDYYTMEVAEDYLTISSSFNDTVVEMIEQNFLSVPSGGGTGFYLSKNALGQLVWLPNEAAASVSRLVSGKGIVSFISGRWYISHDGGTTVRRVATRDDITGLINDAVSGYNSTLSSQKITELLGNKVTKVEGKGLSTNDLTNDLLNKLNKIVTNGTETQVKTATGEYKSIGDVLTAAGYPTDGSGGAVSEYDTWQSYERDDSPKTHKRFYFIKDATSAPFYNKESNVSWGMFMYDKGSTNNVKVIAPVSSNDAILSDDTNYFTI